jgi:hypothetical protein
MRINQGACAYSRNPLEEIRRNDSPAQWRGISENEAVTVSEGFGGITDLKKYARRSFALSSLRAHFLNTRYEHT